MQQLSNFKCCSTFESLFKKVRRSSSCKGPGDYGTLQFKTHIRRFEDVLPQRISLDADKTYPSQAKACL